MSGTLTESVVRGTAFIWLGIFEFQMELSTLLAARERQIGNAERLAEDSA